MRRRGSKPIAHARGVAPSTETLALFAVFVVIQPFERWWMGADAVGTARPGARPDPVWFTVTSAIAACGGGCGGAFALASYRVATINLEPPLAGIDRLAARLGERIEALLAETGAETVMLVTHSMGGLAARAYLRAYGAARVAGLVTLAAPHHGTRIARLGLGRNAREMEPNSEWLRSLNAEPAAIDPDRQPLEPR